ncbi:MAG: FecR family protein [Elusimicrobiales bacterium]|nr:FecR family protein [Elusimicrobiales bacterium]
MKSIYFFTVLFLAAQTASASAPREIVLVPEGAVEARQGAASAWAPVQGRTRLAEGSEIRTGKNSKAAVFFSDGSTFLLGNSSIFAVEDTSKKKAGFSLKVGRLKAIVSGYFASRFQVRTPAAVCAVRGTEFDIEVGKDGATGMNVTEGLVEVNDSKGAMAVVSSEEKIKIGMDGMSRPEGISLNDERAGEAARPMAVRQETARERTRTMLEELRNRELKANESQLGKDSIDAFGRRVRLEEYLLRPSDSEFKLLFLSRREESHRLDWGHLIERFNSKIPDDINEVGKVIDSMYFSATAPTNWMKYFEVYMTNTVDSIKETIDFTAPVAINFAGYGAGTRYYPGSIDYRQILSGPGVAVAAGAGSLTNTGLTSLAADERVQFRQIQDYNTTTAGQFTFTQKVVNASGILNDMYQVTLNQASLADVGAGGTATLYNAAIDPEALTPAYSNYPSGPGKADFLAYSLYADGSSVSSRKLLVSNEGDILNIGGSANSNTFLKEGSFNLELVLGSSLFQGRNIDILFAPEILTQKKDATTTADSFAIN